MNLSSNPLPNRPTAAIAGLLVVQLIFGLNYVVSKIILNELPPIAWAAIRISIAAFLLLLMSFYWVKPAQRVMTASFLKSTLIFGFFGIALNQGFFLLGLKYTSAGNSSILNTLTPIFTLALSCWFGHERWTLFKGLGFALAIGGALTLRWGEGFNLSSQTAMGDLYTVLNCFSLALFFAISRKFLQENSALWVTTWMFIFGAVLLSIGAIFETQEWVQPHMTPTLWGAMTYNIVLASVITYLLNSWTLTQVKPSTVALFIYLQPVVAAIHAWAFFYEQPTLPMAFAIGLIFCGLLVGMKGSKT